MDVQLYVYDLSRGMARQLSQQFLGGSTHHGQPMEIAQLGATHLPLEIILEYLDSLKEVYTPESYDLFAHNCNNFSNDFAMFLVGKGIPDHITNLPRRVLDTPFGQMLKPQIDASMRSITQAPVPQQNVPASRHTNGAASADGRSKPGDIANKNSTPALPGRFGNVLDTTSLEGLEKQLHSASDTAVTIFFTSSTCAPCKMAYPMFDQLAGQFPDALFLKADINGAREVAERYQIRATPTFMTFSKGALQDQWSGADPNQLKAKVEMLIQLTFPPHPHTQLRLPTLQFGSMKPVTYTKVPPLEKLMAKLGKWSSKVPVLRINVVRAANTGNVLCIGYIWTLRRVLTYPTKAGTAASDPELVALKSFIEKREKDVRDASLPEMNAAAFQDKILALPLEVRFAAVDLLRCAMIDTRFSGFFAEQGRSSIVALFKHMSDLDNTCPHNLRLVTIHLACNIFSSPLFVQELMRQDNQIAPLLVQLITSSLLDASHPTTRVASASLAFNLSVANYRIRREENREGLVESEQVELAASLLETLSTEENADAVKPQLLALGFLLYCAPQEGELMDLVKALDAKSMVGSCKVQQQLAREIAGLL